MLDGTEFEIAVSEYGIHICVDDILTPERARQLMKDIENALFDWRKLTGKVIGKKKGIAE
jgi:hypothetical protein